VLPDACRLVVKLDGETASGTAATAGLYFEVSSRPTIAEPERDYDILRVLKATTAAGLVPEADHVSDEDLDRLALEGRIELPLRGRIRLDGGGADIGDECIPCIPGVELPPGLTCQATADWTLVRGYAANACQGELVLVRSCNPVSRMLQRIGQLYSHVGMLTRHNLEIAHATVAEDRYSNHPAEDDPGDHVTDGIDEGVLRHGWPGAIVQPLDDAFRVTWRDDPGGLEYKIQSFSWQPQLCSFDGALVAPQVLRAAPGREAELAAPLAAAAERARAIALGDGAHYRLFSYSDGAIVLDDAFDGPLAGQRDATCCSTFVWVAFQRAGPVELEGAPEEGEVVDAETPDGLYFYDEEVRRTAAEVMYEAIYDAAYAEGGWLGVLFADAPDDLANQICNCFASFLPRGTGAWSAFTPAAASATRKSLTTSSAPARRTPRRSSRRSLARRRCGSSRIASAAR
jgi:hypothetical protein